jgi:hypothetical protein
VTDNGDRTGSFIIPPAPEKVAGKQLQQRINKRSFLAGRALLAGVTGTMDAAISYPIQRRTENTYFQAVAGINSIMLVLRSFYQLRNCQRRGPDPRGAHRVSSLRENSVVWLRRRSYRASVHESLPHDPNPAGHTAVFVNP